MIPSRLPPHWPTVLVLLLALSGCASTGEYVWIDQIPDPLVPLNSEYIITPADLLDIRVFGNDNVSGKVRVRSDGKISLPLLNDQVAAGLSPGTLAQLLAAGLKTFMVNPVVTVAVEETHPFQVTVLGEVARPGVYKLDAGSDVLTTLALAGGLTPFARREGIFLLRRLQVSTQEAPRRALRIRFSYGALTRGEGRASIFRLQDGDALVIE